MPTPQDEIVRLYENLHSKYEVNVRYQIGLPIKPKISPEDANLSQDVLTLLQHLNNNQLSPTDFEQKTSLKIKLTNKAGEYVADFEQNDEGYMAVFDEDELINFLRQYALHYQL